MIEDKGEDKEYPVFYGALLRRMLDERLGFEELKTVAFDLALELDSLPGEGKSAKAREMVAFLQRRGRLEELVINLETVQPDTNWPRPMPGSKTNPYRALKAYSEEDAGFFYGRLADEKRLVAVLQKSAFLAVVGPSGSGKSSVVFAGLVPRLRREKGWLIVSMRPRKRPFHELANALLPLLDATLSPVDLLDEGDKLAKALVEGRHSLANINERILALHPDAQQVLLIIDQFEELYTLGDDEQYRHRFLDVLISEVQMGQQLPKTLLTLRGDFVGQALEYGPFVESLREGTYLLGPMSRQEMQDAVILPARRMNVGFEEGLVNRILDDVGSEAGQIPLLSFCLSELWKMSGAGQIRHVAYEAIGQVDGALASHAQAMYEKLAPGEREELRRVFLALVQPGRGTEDTRRVVKADELEELWPVAQSLAGSDLRLVVVGRDEADKETAELAHEALIRHWPLLREWLDENRANLRLLGEIRRVAEKWWENGREDYLEHSGSRLEQVKNLEKDRALKLGSVVKSYVYACEQQAWSEFHITVDYLTAPTVIEEIPDGQHRWPVVIDYLVAGSQLPARVEGDLCLDGNLKNQLLADELFDLLQYGTRLGKMLFTGQIYAAFIYTWARSGGQLKVTISVADPELRQFHWELLCAPFESEQWRLLALESGVSYSNYVASDSDRNYPRLAKEDLRALVVLPTPLDEIGNPILDPDSSLKNMLGALGDIPFDLLATMGEAIGPPTLAAMCFWLKKRSYSFLIIETHGIVRQGRNEVSLAFANEDNEIDVVLASRLIEGLKAIADDWIPPHLIYLECGYSAAVYAEKSNKGLPYRLVNELGVPAVLGMSTLWTLEVSRAFNSAFLTRLRQYPEIERAVSATRWSLAGHSHITVPVLYQRLKNRPLFKSRYAIEKQERALLHVTVGSRRAGQSWRPVTAEYESEAGWMPYRREDKLDLDLDRLQSLSDPLDYGRLLGQAIFNGSIGQILKQARSDNGSDLRLLLSITDPALQGLHWEWTCVNVEDQWVPLLLIEDIIFSVYQATSYHRPFTFVKRDRLRALVAIPIFEGGYGFEPVDRDVELRRSGFDFASNQHTVLSKDSPHGNAELYAMRRQLLANQYQILHLTVHARSQVRSIISDDFGLIGLFMPNDGSARRKKYTLAKEFLGQIGRLKSLPHFAFLTLPDKAGPEEGLALAEVARMLLSEAGMFAVLAIIHPMPAPTVEAFSKHFYKMLVTHGEVDRAYNEAGIVAAAHPGFVSPVLYSRLESRPLFYA